MVPSGIEQVRWPSSTSPRIHEEEKRRTPVRLPPSLNHWRTCFETLSSFTEVFIIAWSLGVMSGVVSLSPFCIRIGSKIRTREEGKLVLEWNDRQRTFIICGIIGAFAGLNSTDERGAGCVVIVIVVIIIGIFIGFLIAFIVILMVALMATVAAAAAGNSAAAITAITAITAVFIADIIAVVIASIAALGIFVVFEDLDLLVQVHASLLLTRLMLARRGAQAVTDSIGAA
jgi:hypothetical protein